MFNWRLWGRGLLAAALGGAVPALLVTPTNWKAIGAAALLAGLTYLKTHPVPGEEQ